MVKYFCDKCGTQVDKFYAFKINIDAPEIMSWGDVAKTGDYILCYHCAIDFNKWIGDRKEVKK